MGYRLLVQPALTHLPLAAVHQKEDEPSANSISSDDVDVGEAAVRMAAAKQLGEPSWAWESTIGCGSGCPQILTGPSTADRGFSSGGERTDARFLAFFLEIFALRDGR
jgi:hypothetical protein